MKVQLIYNALADSVIVELNEVGVEDLERVDVADGVVAWFRADTPDQLVSLGVSRLDRALEDRGDVLAELLGQRVLDEIVRVRNANLLRERPALDRVERAEELRDTLQSARAVEEALEVPDPSSQQRDAWQAARGEAPVDRRQTMSERFVLVVKAATSRAADAARSGAEQIVGAAQGAVERSSEPIQRSIRLTPVALQPAAEAAGGAKARVRYEWHYGADNPGKLWIDQQDNQLWAHMYSWEYRGRTVTLFCKLHREAAGALKPSGDYDPANRELAIKVRLGTDGHVSKHFASTKRRDHHFTQGQELLEWFTPEVEAPLERERIQRGDTTILALEGDILAEPVDAIVNPADPYLHHDTGLAAEIVRVGGEPIQQESYTWLHEQHGGEPLDVGQAAVTRAGQLPARLIVHLVSPSYDRASTDNDHRLSQAVQTALEAAAAKVARSVALPLIGTGANGYPLDEAARAIVTAVADHATSHPDALTEIRLVAPGEDDEYDPDAPRPADSLAEALRAI